MKKRKKYLDPTRKPLTDRENQVLGFVLLGGTSEYIAEKIYLSKHTVNNYRSRILRYFKVGSTAELQVLLKDRI